MFDQTVFESNRLNCWKIMPMPSRMPRSSRSGMPVISRAVDGDAARRRGLQRVDEAHERGLARAGVADDAEDVAGLDVEAHVVDGDDGRAAAVGRRVGLGDVGEAHESHGCSFRHAETGGGAVGAHRPLASRSIRVESVAGAQPLAAFGVGLDLGERLLQVGDRRGDRHRGAAGCLEQRRLHLGVGLEDLDELQVGLVVRVLGARREDVHVGQRVRVARVVLRDRVLEAEAGVRDEVVVDDGGRDVRAATSG